MLDVFNVNVSVGRNDLLFEAHDFRLSGKRRGRAGACLGVGVLKKLLFERRNWSINFGPMFSDRMGRRVRN